MWSLIWVLVILQALLPTYLYIQGETNQITCAFIVAQITEIIISNTQIELYFFWQYMVGFGESLCVK